MIIIGYAGGSRVGFANGEANRPMYVGATIDISNALRTHSYSSPSFHAYPYITYYLYDTMVYNPQMAYGDGDSLHVDIVPALTWYDHELNFYTYPYREYVGATNPDTMYMHAATGEVKWVKPEFLGYYCYVFTASMFNHGSYVGSITRDMLIHIVSDTTVIALDTAGWWIKDSIVNTYRNYTPDTIYTGLIGVFPGQPLSCYPSPTSGSIAIDMSSYTPADRQLTIYDALGQMVYTTTTHQDQYLLSYPLPPGVYTATVTQGSQFGYARFVRQ